VTVIDASAAALLLLPDEDDALRQKLEAALRERPISAFHFRSEVTSLVLKAIRRGRIPPGSRAAIQDRAEALIRRVDSDYAPPVTAVIAMAERYGLSAYDASYLWLAVDQGARLLAMDGPLRRAAIVVGIAA
jgi:predicted nucleic acid-binding protein